MGRQTEEGGSTFQAGGALSTEAPSYIEREADAELLAATWAGEFCYVFSSHQMGKSSLVERTAYRLSLEDDSREACIPIVVHLKDIEPQATAELWHFAFLDKIRESAKLDVDLKVWWEENRKVPNTERLTRFFSQVLLKQRVGKIVVFVDELERTLGQPYSETLCAAVKACYDARSQNPVFRRLGFVFAGVVLPDDLVKDPRNSPFPAGRAIRLHDFTEQEAKSLVDQLVEDEPTRRQLLQQLIFWARGQPYLTHKLCQLIDNSQKFSTEEIDELILAKFLEPDVRKTEEYHLRVMQDRLSGKGLPSRIQRRRRPVLLAYRTTKSDRELHVEMLPTTICDELVLSGLALPDDDGFLTVRNPLYDQVFDSKWLRRHVPFSRPAIIVMASFLLLLLTAAVYIEWIYPRQLIDTLRTAADDTTRIDKVERAYKELRWIPWYESLADREWGLFAERRARRAIQGDSLQEDPRYYELALHARKQIESWNVEAAREAWDADSREWLARFYDQRAIRCMGGHGERKKAILWTIEASRIHNDENRQNRLDAYTRGLAALQNTFSMDYQIQQMRWTPDGQLVLLGTLGSSVYLHDVFKQRLDVLTTPADVRLVQEASNGLRVVSVSGANYVRLWDVQTADPPKALTTPVGEVTFLAISGDGSQIVTVVNNRLAQLWNGETGELRSEFEMAAESVVDLATSPDARRLVAVGKDGVLRLWDTETGLQEWEYQYTGPPIAKTDFSPDGKTILCQSFELPVARLLNSQTGQEVLTLEASKPAFSPDGSYIVGIQLASLGADSGETVADVSFAEAAVFDLAKQSSEPSPVSLPPFRSSPASNALGLTPGPNAERLVAVSDSLVQVLDSTTGDILLSAPRPNANNSKVPAQACFSSDGRLVALAIDSHHVQVWRTDAEAPTGIRLEGHEKIVCSAAFNQDGSLLATGSWDGAAEVWDPASGVSTATLETAAMPVWIASFSPDGQSVACAAGMPGADLTAGLYQVSTGHAIVQLDGFELAPSSAAFAKMTLSSDGQVVALANTLWDTSTGAKSGTLTVLESERVINLAFSRDDKFIAGTIVDGNDSSKNGRVQIWDVASGQEVLQPQNAVGETLSLAFSPDGLFLFDAGRESLTMWDARTGNAVKSLECPDIQVTAIALSPDGSGLFTLSPKLIREYTWNADGLELRAAWPAAQGCFASRNLAFEESLDEVRVVEAGNLRSPTIVDLRRSIEEPDPLPPCPEEVKLAWQDKLGLKIFGDGKITPDRNAPQ